MQKIIIEKPYQFVPPHRGNWWPTFIQRFKLIDIYLRKSQGVETYECRHTEKFSESLRAGHGIMLCPNHARPGDPIAMGWLAREAKTHVYAMASWHLYHQDWFTTWSIKKMGGFSVYREGMDRKALNTAVEILETAERPLILFPEGAVTRTNDKLAALLDGVSFMARTAAKKRKKSNPDSKVVIHPVAIKYLFKGDLEAAITPVLAEIESRLSWKPKTELPLIERVRSIGFALLTLKELEYFGQPQVGKLANRLDNLIDRLLHPIENEWLGKALDGPVVPRIKALRMKIVPDLVSGDIAEKERERRWSQLADLYLSQQVYSYPPDYLREPISADCLLETVERYEEDLNDIVRVHGKLHAIIDVGDAIEVAPERDRASKSDPVMDQLESNLQSMLDELATESTIWQHSEP